VLSAFWARFLLQSFFQNRTRSVSLQSDVRALFETQFLENRMAAFMLFYVSFFIRVKTSSIGRIYWTIKNRAEIDLTERTLLVHTWLTHETSSHELRRKREKMNIETLITALSKSLALLVKIDERRVHIELYCALSELYTVALLYSIEKASSIELREQFVNVARELARVELVKSIISVVASSHEL